MKRNKTSFRISVVIVFILLLFSITSFASDSLSESLKLFKNKLEPEVEELLVYYADNNQYLNSLEMQQAAYVASKVDEWEIAGFYCIARPMISGLSLKGARLDNVTDFKNMKELRKYWKKLDSRLNPLRKIKKFKELKKLRTVELMPCNEEIKLFLINNVNFLKKASILYEQWKPTINDDYHYIPNFKINKTELEINILFNQLNEIYVKANQDFIKLLAIPRYKELKLLSYNGMEDFTKKLNEGKVDFNKLNKDPDFMKKMMAFGNNKREMEQIEIDNLLFPEISWGSWY